METMLRSVLNDCVERESILEDNERLDEIIQELQRRNTELQGMLGSQVYSQANDYQDKLMNTLSGRQTEQE